MSGTGEDISQVHWKQQWLQNGTLYFHVSMTESELLAQTTQPTAREPAHVLHEHMHLLHISVMVGDIHQRTHTHTHTLVFMTTRYSLDLSLHNLWNLLSLDNKINSHAAHICIQLS